MDSGVATEKNECGGVEGPEAMYVKLIASDGHEFIMKRSHALTSGTIKAMLSGPGKLCFGYRASSCRIDSGFFSFQASFLKTKQMK